MTATELIKELQDRIELYGDCQVVYRTDQCEFEDLEVHSAYGDEDANKICLTDTVWWDCM